MTNEKNPPPCWACAVAAITGQTGAEVAALRNNWGGMCMLNILDVISDISGHQWGINHPIILTDLPGWKFDTNGISHTEPWPTHNYGFKFRNVSFKTLIKRLDGKPAIVGAASDHVVAIVNGRIIDNQPEPPRSDHPVRAVATERQ